MTAIEWLIEQIKFDHNQKALSAYQWIQVIEQAKEMHKQEIIDAVNQTEFTDIDGFGISETLTKGEQYYNETFKNQKQCH